MSARFPLYGILCNRLQPLFQVLCLERHDGPPWHPPKMRTHNPMLISLLAPSLLLAAEEPPPTSMLPLSDQLLLKHYGETTPPADSGYGTERRRRLTSGWPAFYYTAVTRV